MAANVQVVRLTGAGPAATDVTSGTTRASTSDSPTPGTNDPIPIPNAGTNHSYWVTTRLNAVTSPAGTINNLRFYSDGANGYGTGVTATAQEATSYVQATGTQGQTGTELTVGNHAGLTGAPVDPFTWTSGAPKTVAGSITNPTTGQFGSRMVEQLHVASTAGPGTLTAEQFTWVYDET